MAAGLPIAGDESAPGQQPPDLTESVILPFGDRFLYLVGSEFPMALMRGGERALLIPHLSFPIIPAFAVTPFFGCQAQSMVRVDFCITD